MRDAGTCFGFNDVSLPQEFDTSRSNHSPNSMQVRISVSRLVVVDDDVDSLDIDSSSKDVRANEDSLLEGLELLVSLDSLILTEAGMDADGGEVAILEELVELGGSGDGLDEDADLKKKKKKREIKIKLAPVFVPDSSEQVRTWLNSSESRRSLSFRFFSFSSSWT